MNSKSEEDSKSIDTGEELFGRESDSKQRGIVRNKK